MRSISGTECGTEGRVVALRFEDGTWTRRVLAREADRRRHLEEALELVEPDESAANALGSPIDPWN